MAQTLRFYQLHDGYAYNSDSLLLLDFAANFLSNTSKLPLHTTKKSPLQAHIKPPTKPMRVLDMGAGCGILGVSCALHFGAQVVAIECNPTMAHLATINARTNLQNLYQPHNQATSRAQHIPSHDSNESSQYKNVYKKAFCEVICADFLDTNTPNTAISVLNSLQICDRDFRVESSANIVHVDSATDFATKPQRFDAIIANPPFYHGGTLESTNTHLALARYERALPLRAWIHQSKRLLTQRGALIFCYQASVLPRVLESLELEGFTCEQLRLIYPLINRSAKLALLYARLDSRAKLNILPPLITHNSPEQSDFTQEVVNIYTRYPTHSIKVYANDVVGV